MIKLKLLKEKRNSLVQQMKDLTDTAETEQRAFSAEEESKFNDLDEQVKALDKTIKAQERAKELMLTDRSEPGNGEGDAEKERAEERAFENYIRGVVEERADANLAAGDNGAVIPTSIANKIIKRVHEISPLYSMATKYNVKGELQIPYYSAKENGATVQMAYAEEFVDLESTAGKFASISLKGFLAGALCKISKSLVNNSQFNIVNFVVSEMAEQISIWLEGQLLNGTANKAEGVIAGITQTVKAPSATVLTADDVIRLQETIPDAFQEKAVFIMSRATRTALRLLKDGEGRYILNPDATSKWGYTLFGKPAYVSENMSDIETGKPSILYGDFSGLAVKLSESMDIQVLREKFATQHAIGVVAWMEFDAKVENAQKLAKLVMA